MALTNSQHDAIMRIYDAIQTNNRHIQNEHFEEAVRLCPEIQDIENEIITISMSAATGLITNSSDISIKDYHKQLELLNKKKSDCLLSINMPADYLDPIYTCPLCHDTGYVGQKKCSCFTKKAIDLVYKDSNIKNIMDNENFDTLSLDWYDKNNIDASVGCTPYENMQRVVTICHAFTDDFDNENANLLLLGAPGIGKTFLTNCMAKELLDSSHSVIYLTATEFFQQFEHADFNKPDTSSISLDGNYILDCDLLIIDDLGTEVINSYTNSKLFYCLNERILRQKSIIISTNLSLGDIKNTYSERIFSRLTSSCRILKLVGKDIRLMKKTGQKP